MHKHANSDATHSWPGCPAHQRHLQFSAPDAAAAAPLPAAAASNSDTSAAASALAAAEGAQMRRSFKTTASVSIGRDTCTRARARKRARQTPWLAFVAARTRTNNNAVERCAHSCARGAQTGAAHRRNGRTHPAATSRQTHRSQIHGAVVVAREQHAARLVVRRAHRERARRRG